MTDSETGEENIQDESEMSNVESMKVVKKKTPKTKPKIFIYHSISKRHRINYK